MLTKFPVFDAEGQAIGIGSIGNDITERKRAETLMRDLGARLITAREEERRSIARELHDDIGQGLALMTVELELLAQSKADSAAEVGEQLERVALHSKQLASGIHGLSHRLHPAALEQLGLATAIGILCEELSARRDVRISFKAKDLPDEIPAEIALALYRVAQEALNNAVRHSGSGRARAELAGTRGALRMRISDSGTGFDPVAVRGKGLGLVSMHERLRLVGGELTIRAQPGHGTRIEARVPWPPSTPGS